ASREAFQDPVAAVAPAERWRRRSNGAVKPTGAQGCCAERGRDFSSRATGPEHGWARGLPLRRYADRAFADNEAQQPSRFADAGYRRAFAHSMRTTTNDGEPLTDSALH